MNIYIGKDWDGKPTSVLLADNIEKAHIAWAGMKDTPRSVEEINPNDDLGIHGVAFLLTSVEHEYCINGSYKRIRKWIRGL